MAAAAEGRRRTSAARELESAEFAASRRLCLWRKMATRRGGRRRDGDSGRVSRGHGAGEASPGSAQDSGCEETAVLCGAPAVTDL